jgi:hypothetical protein
MFIYLELLVPESFLYVDSNDEDDELTRSINQRGLLDIFIFLILIELYK